MLETQVKVRSILQKFEPMDTHKYCNNNNLSLK